MSQYLPVLLLLACPLMMIFMMRGMGSGMNHGARNDDADRSQQARTEHRDGARPS